MSKIKGELVVSKTRVKKLENEVLKTKDEIIEKAEIINDLRAKNILDIKMAAVNS